MIEFRGVTKVFAGASPKDEAITAVCDFDLVVADGETHCLIGTSGCGKTTALKMVNRLVEPTDGRIFLGEEDTATLDLIQLRRRIGYVIQTGGLFPHMTVGRNIGIMCELSGWSRADTEHRTSELLELVSLDPARFAGRYPAELSGGQQQRVGVARALALDPAHLLMDEPFGALDPITRRGMQDEFLALAERLHKTILLVTHDLNEAFTLGARISLMHRGALVQTGTPEDLQMRPANEFVARFLAGHDQIETTATS